MPLARGGTGVTSISALKSALGISSSSGVQLAITTGTLSVTTTFYPRLVIVIVSSGGTNHAGYGFAIRGHYDGDDDSIPIVIYNQDNVTGDKHYLKITWESNGITIDNNKWVEKCYSIAVFGY